MPNSSTTAIVDADVAYVDDTRPRRDRRVAHEGDVVVAQKPANKYFWLDASQEAFADLAAVHVATDWSPRGWFVQGQGAGTDPIFRTGILNGHPVFRFAAASQQQWGVFAPDFSIGKFGIDITAFELFVVVRVNSIAVVNSVYALANAGPQEYPHVATGHLNGIFGAHGNSYDVGAPPDSILNFCILNVANYPNRQEDVNQNGKVMQVGHAIGSGALQWIAAPTVGTNTSTFLDGDIAELIIWDRLLNGTERAAEKTRLANKYAIVVA